MIIENVYAERRRADVMEETWGHLEPDVGIHAADILFAVGCYESNQAMIIESTIGDLDDSPWLYQDQYELLVTKAPLDPGVYRYTGTYRVLKSGECRWNGSTTLRAVS